MMAPRLLSAAVPFFLFCLLLVHASMSSRERIAYRDQVHDMFFHGYHNYLDHAFPHDELKPLSCTGADTLGGYMLTLIDSLDSLAVFGAHDHFKLAVQLVLQRLPNAFDIDRNVSVFETNIRLMGALVSAHMLTIDPNSPVFDAAASAHPAQSALLRLAVDLGERLLPAFHTATGMPYGTVNLRYGVPSGETPVVATAGAGSFILEFGALSRLTGDRRFEAAARRTLYALFRRKSQKDLFAQHINAENGVWHGSTASTGNYIDSFYEYVLKGHLLLGDPQDLAMFRTMYTAAKKHLTFGAFSVEADLNSGTFPRPVTDSLQAFWPGLQVLYGDVSLGVDGALALSAVWSELGFLPEGLDITTRKPIAGRTNFPLRPELAESLFYAYAASRDPRLLSAAVTMVDNLQHLTRVPCGFAAVKDVLTKQLEDKMDSFFLAETLKYLYLVFTVGDEHLPNTGPVSARQSHHDTQRYASIASEMLQQSAAMGLSPTENQGSLFPEHTADSTVDSIHRSQSSKVSSALLFPRVHHAAWAAWVLNDNYIFTTEAHLLPVSLLYQTQQYTRLFDAPPSGDEMTELELLSAARLAQERAAALKIAHDSEIAQKLEQDSAAAADAAIVATATELPKPDSGAWFQQFKSNDAAAQQIPPSTSEATPSPPPSTAPIDEKFSVLSSFLLKLESAAKSGLLSEHELVPLRTFVNLAHAMRSATDPNEASEMAIKASASANEAVRTAERIAKRIREGELKLNDGAQSVEVAPNGHTGPADAAPN